MKMAFLRSPRERWLTACGVLFSVFPLSGSGIAAGFTEPPVIFYGQINQTYNGYTIPASGALTWVIQSTATGSSTVLASTTPGIVAGASFYRLEVPVEKLPPGFSLSGNTISTATTTFNRGNITLDGAPVSIVYPTTADRATFTFTETARGKMDHLDLAIMTPFLDSDGDGIPDWWEDLYGLNKYDPSDATTIDPAGHTWLDDYNNHVDPTAANLSEYTRWTNSYSLQGSAADPTTDSDNDGIPNLLEFALGTNPNVGDNALAAQRSLVQIESDKGGRFLTLTVQKPGRTSVNYVVETSGDLKTWSSVEGKDIITLMNTASLLKVRAARYVDATRPGATFLRLRVILLQR